MSRQPAKLARSAAFAPLPAGRILQRKCDCGTHRAGGGKTVIEYSGGTTLANVRSYAECGVDRISIGGITKHLRAVDLSMRFT